MVSSSSGRMPVMNVYGRGTDEFCMLLFSHHTSQMDWLVWFGFLHSIMSQKHTYLHRTLLNNLDYTKNSENTKLYKCDGIIIATVILEGWE